MRSIHTGPQLRPPSSPAALQSATLGCDISHEDSILRSHGGKEVASHCYIGKSRILFSSVSSHFSSALLLTFFARTEHAGRARLLDMRYHTQYNVLEDEQNVQLHEYKSFETLKQASASAEEVLQRPSEYDQAGGHLLRRFYFRALVGCLGPLVVTAYFIILWRIYLAPIDPESPIAFGPPGATWIFYSWFVVGVIGLNLSMYGMQGVEAGMMMEPHWQAGDGMKLMMHANNTWSGPGGWMKTIKWSWHLSRRAGRVKLPAALWFILTLPSMFVFTAYPLSGLTMEMTQGFLRGTRSNVGPTVTGFSYANFNERNMDDAFSGSRVTWTNALESRISGHGALYTPQGFDRSQHSFLQKLPTILPKDDGVHKIFLAAQAENPIEGQVWGLLLQYNCSIVDKMADLRILNTRNASAVRMSSLGYTSYQTSNETLGIAVQNQTNLNLLNKWVDNMYAVMETGYEMWPNKTASQRMMKEDPNAVFTKNTACYFNEAENITGDYPGIDQEQLFEVVLWQSLLNTSYGPPGIQGPQYNFSLDRNISDLYGAYNWRDFAIDNTPPAFRNQTTNMPLRPMSAIGVQCKASSSVGTVSLNGQSSTYTNFTRTDTPINIQTARCASRFTASSPSLVMPKPGSEWLSTLFSSAAAPPPLYAASVTSDTDIDANYGYLVQLGYLQAEQLRVSMTRAYAAYAVQLMFNGGQGYTSRDGSHIGFQNPNVTEFVRGTVITQGVMPAAIPVVLFVAWALVASVLGVLYGFRRRWSAILDGYAMFRLGADLSADEKARFAACSNTLEVEECEGLGGVPGLVGDVTGEMWLGRIGLVRGPRAEKGKMYE
ncbi:hypothetical protein EK21DRAFT_101653 [Setomelanomma holmii]|uniref:Uncharacterized protein n=1 Tax=Setomelanomma holmii TaxID=210430 RepID=A0A9P4H6Y5_9PLEO|nr:hypothetical protein EK21DRAFT_101653 [Setomelanomma holmii]